MGTRSIDEMKLCIKKGRMKGEEWEFNESKAM